MARPRLKLNRLQRTKLFFSDLVHGLQRYHISLEGYGLIGVMTLVGFAAWHSGTNLLYLLFAMLISFFLAHGFMVSLSLRGLDIKRVLPRHVTAMQTITVPVQVRNRKWLLSSYGLRIQDFTADEELFGTAFAVRAPRRSTVETSYHAVFPKRGWYSLRRMEVLTRFPFGLAERGMSSFRNQDILVYPQVLETNRIVSQLTAEFGEQDIARKGPGSDLYGLREYVPGEHARHIHWKSSAKARRLVVMEYEKEERKRISLALHNLVSVNETPALDPDTVETAVILAASLCDRYLNDGFEVELITASGTIPFGNGKPHLSRILHALAELETLTSGHMKRSTDKRSGYIINVVLSSAAKGPLLTMGPVLDARQWSVVAGELVQKLEAA